MKKVKRIFAVFLLILTVLAIGYLFYTGSRTLTVQEEEPKEASYAQTEDI